MFSLQSAVSHQTEVVNMVDMEQEDTLKEIPPADFQPLLDDLKSDFPNSIHAWSFLKTIERWRAHDTALCVKILAINGDYRSKFIVIYTSTPNISGTKGSFHKWSHREDDDELIREALKNSKEFPRLYGGMCFLTALTEESDRAVVPFLREIWKNEHWNHEAGHFVYWFSKEDALNLEVDLPKGTYIAMLTDAHAKEINEVWPHRHKGSQLLIEAILQINFGIGIFDSESHELMAWVLQFFYGGLGALQTKEHHKRKGYGSIVLKAATKELAKRGEDGFLNVLPDNIASKMLVEKMNYRFAFKGSWIFKGMNMLNNELSDFQGAIHKWSFKEDDEEIVRKSLKTTKQIPWHNPRLLITGLTPETAKAVLPVFSELMEEGTWYSDPDRVYWIPKEVAEKWVVETPKGTYISFLNDTHAKEVDEFWPHRYDGSLDLISCMIRVNFGIGLFDSGTHELMAWALHWFYGAIGVLQTKDQHKKKGCGIAVVKAISREIACRGDDVFLNILPHNIPSINLVEKLGFNYLMNGLWIFKGF